MQPSCYDRRYYYTDSAQPKNNYFEQGYWITAGFYYLDRADNQKRKQCSQEKAATDLIGHLLLRRASTKADSAIATSTAPLLIPDSGS